MNKVVIDTNFILNCIREKIDLFENLQEIGFKIVIPVRVIEELNQIKNSKQKLKHRDEAELALKILDKYSFEKIKLESKNTDNGLVIYLKKNPDLFFATMDRNLSKKVKNRKIVLRSKKKLEVL